MTDRLKRVQYLLTIILGIQVTVIISGFLFDLDVPDPAYYIAAVMSAAIAAIIMISGHAPEKALISAGETLGLKKGKYLFDGDFEHRLVTDFFEYAIGGNIDKYFVRAGFYTKIREHTNTYIIVVPKKSKAIHNRLVKKSERSQIGTKHVQSQSYENIKGDPRNLTKKAIRRLRKHLPQGAPEDMGIQIFEKGVLLKIKGKIRNKDMIHDMIIYAVKMMKETKA